MAPPIAPVVGAISPPIALGVVALCFAVAYWILGRSAKTYQSQLSRRYLLRRFSAAAAFLAVAFGVAIILVVLSIMGGYVDVFRDSVRGQESDLLIIGPKQYGVTRVGRLEKALRSIENVAATAPSIEALAMYRSGGFNPCQLRGIDVQDHVKVSTLGAHTLRLDELREVLTEIGLDSNSGDENAKPRATLAEAIRQIDARLDSLDRAPIKSEEFASVFSIDSRRKLLEETDAALAAEYRNSAPPQAVLVGIQLLLSLELYLGQVIPVITLDPETSEPVNIPLLVAGAFKTGTFEADSKIFYTNVNTVRSKLKLFDRVANSSRYESIRVAVKDIDRLHETEEAIVRRFAEMRTAGTLDTNLKVWRWDSLKSNQIRAVEIEKTVIYFLLVLLIAFTACMVLLMLVLTVIEKTRDIGVLLALGAPPRGIVGIFLINGLVLTLSGTLGGLTLGYVFCDNINPIHDWIANATGLRLFPPEVYDMDRIPISFRFSDVLLAISPALILGFLASLVPAIWAARRDPINAIRFE